jgi:hypothetical protein
MKIGNHILQTLVFSLCVSMAHAAAAESVAQRAALYYAGLDASSPERKSFQTKMKRVWNNYDKKIGTIMSNWAVKEVAYAGGGTVFYPFSGPDFLTADRIFPNADRYVLVSLQKATRPTYPGSMDKGQRENFEKKLNIAWNRFGTLGYFRTDDLDEDQRDKKGRMGITAILMAFAVLQGYEVTDVSPLGFNSNSSKWEPMPADESKWHSVRLSIQKNGRKVTLDYVSMDLSDGGLRLRAKESAWLKTMTASPVLLKAASHLLQEPYFGDLRTMIVNSAPIVVQDETGLNYKDLAKVGSVTLYGNFIKPLGMFKSTRQPALAQAYKAEKNKKELPFAFSYIKNSKMRSVQIARRAVAQTVKPAQAGKPVQVPATAKK